MSTFDVNALHSLRVSFWALFIFIWAKAFPFPSGPMNSALLFAVSAFTRNTRRLGSLKFDSGANLFPSLPPSPRPVNTPHPDSHSFLALQRWNELEITALSLAALFEHCNSPNAPDVLALEAADMEGCLRTETALNLIFTVSKKRTPQLGWPSTPPPPPHEGIEILYLLLSGQCCLLICWLDLSASDKAEVYPIFSTLIWGFLPLWADDGTRTGKSSLRGDGLPNK